MGAKKVRCEALAADLLWEATAASQDRAKWSQTSQPTNAMFMW